MRGNILDRLRLAREPRAGDFGRQLQAQRTPRTTPRAELTTCTTLFADRNQCLEVVLPIFSAGSYCRSLLSAGGHTESTRLLAGPGLITWALGRTFGTLLFV